VATYATPHALASLSKVCYPIIMASLPQIHEQVEKTIMGLF